MILPDVVASHLDMLEAEIRGAGSLTGSLSRNNATAHIGNALAYVELTEEIDRRAEASKQANLTLIASAERAFGAGQVETAREAALVALDALRHSLSGCRASHRARNLGLGW